MLPLAQAQSVHVRKETAVAPFVSRAMRTICGTYETTRIVLKKLKAATINGSIIGALALPHPWNEMREGSLARVNAPSCRRNPRIDGGEALVSARRLRARCVAIDETSRRQIGERMACEDEERPLLG